MYTRRVGILVDEPRADNLFIFQVAHRLEEAGIATTFVFPRVDGHAAFAQRTGGDPFSPPGWRNRLALRIGAYDLLLRPWVREFRRREFDGLLSVLDYGVNGYLLGRAAMDFDIPGFILSRCLIAKPSVPRIVQEPRGLQRRNLVRSIRPLLLRGGERYKQFSRSRNLYLAWGGYEAERLRELGVPNENVQVVGSPLFGGLLTDREKSEFARARSVTPANARLSETALFFSQPLEAAGLLGPTVGMRVKADLLGGIARAGFKKVLIHLHPDEHELPDAWLAQFGLVIEQRRGLPMATRIRLLQEHGWFFTFFSTTVLEALYAGAYAFLYQDQTYGEVQGFLPGFPVLNSETVADARSFAVEQDTEWLLNHYLGDVDRALDMTVATILSRLSSS